MQVLPCCCPWSLSSSSVRSLSPPLSDRARRGMPIEGPTGPSSTDVQGAGPTLPGREHRAVQARPADRAGGEEFVAVECQPVGGRLSCRLDRDSNACCDAPRSSPCRQGRRGRGRCSRCWRSSGGAVPPGPHSASRARLQAVQPQARPLQQPGTRSSARDCPGYRGLLPAVLPELGRLQ